MSMVEQQVKVLREMGNWVSGIPEIDYYGDGGLGGLSSALHQAADTIEALSAKMAAANMARSDRYYGGGWIACEERLPEEEKYYLVTIINWEKNPAIEYCLFQNGKWYIVADGSLEENTAWKEEINSVIAWQPLPEPYCP